MSTSGIGSCASSGASNPNPNPNPKPNPNPNPNLFSDTLDEWLNVQRAWMYLESIFKAADIQRQLPNEYKQFDQVNKLWLDLMRKTNTDPSALKVRIGLRLGLADPNPNPNPNPNP